MADEAETTPAGPLAGVRVLELGSLLAGPFVGRLLGDFGAEVIKVEAPDMPDPMRVWGRHRYKGRSLWWPIQSRNKSCITLNLRLPEGQELLKRLAAKADILVENFRPGTMEKWGLGWEELSAVNPRLIMVRVSGFGQTGPYRDRAGFGAVGEAMGGIRYITGYPDRPPTRIGISIGDSLAAMFATIGALAALHERERSGLGQVVDSAITEAVFALMESAIAEYGRVGFVRERTGNILPNVAPSNVYPTKGGGYLVIAANQDNVFRRLAEVMGRPELAEDPRYATHTARGEHQEELDEIIAAWSVQYTKEELWERLNAAGVPAGPIYSIADIAHDPQFRARDMILMVDDPEIGPMEMPGIVPKLSRTPGSVRSSGPSRPGEHNEVVLKGLLGLTDEDLRRLGEAGVI
jgi:crotonobetainyl-CoA:carnitine CoA-transferase CaiB-like acyl-CoA transferase